MIYSSTASSSRILKILRPGTTERDAMNTETIVMFVVLGQNSWLCVLR